MPIQVRDWIGIKNSKYNYNYKTVDDALENREKNFINLKLMKNLIKEICRQFFPKNNLKIFAKL